MSNTKGKQGKFRMFWHNWKGKIWFLINVFFTVMYLCWRIFFTIPFEYGIVSIIAGFALLIVEVLGMVEAFVHFANMYSVNGYELPKVPVEMYPDVDVFIATYSEDPALLYKTINGCKYMEYPEIAKAIEELEEKFAGEGRVLIRPSGTEPKVRVMIEGKEQQVIEQEAKKLADLIQNTML